MDNLLLFPREEGALALSKELGFTKTFFLEDLLLLEGDQLKTLRQRLSRAKGKLVLFRPQTPGIGRLALEKLPVQIIWGWEALHGKDSLHHPRGGLDQVLAGIAQRQGKKMGFSFHDLLEAQERGQLLRRMQFNVRICHKFGVPMFFGNFSRDKMEMRSAKDLLALWQLLGGRKEEMVLPLL